MNQRQKEDELKRLLPLFWNSFQHMYDTRVSNTKNSTNFLLVTISFLPLVSITLFTQLNQPLFLLALILETAAFTIILKSLFISTPEIHWFKIENTLQDIKNKDFDKKLISQLKSLEEDTHIYLRHMRKIINLSGYLLVISLWSILVATIFVLIRERSLILYSVTLVLSIIFSMIFYYYQKEPPYTSRRDYPTNLQKISDWVKDSAQKQF